MGFESFLASPFLWLAVAALAAVIEAVSFGLFTLWFVLGALVAFAIAYAGGPLWAQLVAFLVVSIACLLLLRPLVMKMRKRGQEHESTPVGKTALVVEGIDPASMRGRVETPDHMTWSALSSDGAPIEEGARVKVVESRSITLVVERLQGADKG